jgi:hypothetical protein
MQLSQKRVSHFAMRWRCAEPESTPGEAKGTMGANAGPDATAQYACDAEGQVDMSAAIARSDLIAYLVGASGCD